jgi:hypothetical protein
VDAIPRSFFIRSSGRISFIGDGLMTPQELHATIQALFVAYSTPTP